MPWDKKANAQKAADKKTAASKKKKQKTTKAYGASRISNMTIARTGTVGSGDNHVRISFYCDIPYGWIKDFTLDIQVYYADRGWTQLGNGVVTLNKASNVGGNTYTYEFDTPNDVRVTEIKYTAKANSATDSYEYTAYSVKKYTQGKKTKYKLDSTKKKVEYAYFTSSVTGWANLKPAPALQDSDNAAELLKTEHPQRPSRPTAAILSNGAIEVTFDEVKPAEADNTRYVYRCMDGAYTAPAQTSISGAITQAGVTHYVDNSDSVAPGHEYRYYVRAYNNRNEDAQNNTTGSWDDDSLVLLPADLSDPVRTAPVEIVDLQARAYGNDGALVSFYYPSDAYFPALESVKVYYSSDRDELVTNTVSCQSADVTTNRQAMSVIITGLDAGKVWYFAPWLSTGSELQQERFCESVASCVIAATPDPPTILDVPRAVYIDSQATVTWTHNCEDGSAQEAARVIATITSGSTTTSRTYTVTTAEECTITFDAETYPDLSTVVLSVSTKGAADDWSQPSESTAISVYAVPIAEISVLDGEVGEGDFIDVPTLPLNLSMSVRSESGTMTQNVIRWTVSICFLESGTYTDAYGNEVMAIANEISSQAVIDSSDDEFTQPTQSLPVAATQAVFVEGMTYSVSMTALMDSGLEVESNTVNFKCTFVSGMADPFAFLVPNADWSVRIYPSVTERREIADGEDYVIDNGIIRLAGVTEGDYTLKIEYIDENDQPAEFAMQWNGSATEEAISGIYGWLEITSVSYGSGASFTELTGQSFSYPLVRENTLLSVYRVDQDGSMSEVCVDYPNEVGIFCVDRHPSFGEMQYRIVANDLLTDSITYCDVSDENDWSGILIQWDEQDISSGIVDDEYQFAFEFVNLPWNVTIQQTSAKDVAYKNYQGRSHPVALYGSQVGESGSWSCEIIKDIEDLELVQLRKLGSYMGSCWVREPTGLSYPANVDVNITRAYDSRAVSVSLEVKRVDD